MRNVTTVFLFAIYFTIILLLYFPTAGAGFVTDQIGWFDTYAKMGWQGLFTAFTDKSIHFVYHLFGFTFWKLFGFNGTAWFITFSFLHAVAATLAYLFFTKLFGLLRIVAAKPIAFAGTLLFVVSPYNTEALVWYACVHYLVSTVFMLMALLAFFRFTETARYRYLAYYFLAFTTAVFCLEISFTLPLIIAVLIPVVSANSVAVKRPLKLFTLFVLPGVAIVLFYFLLNKLLRGDFAGHYGAATHFNTDVQLISATFFKYVAKHFLLTQFWTYETRMWLYNFCDEYGHVCLMLVFALLPFIYLYVRGRKELKSFVVFILLSLGFGLALAPVINLFFTTIVTVEGDRFSYWPGIFSSQLVALVFFSLPAVLRWPSVLSFFAASLFTLHVNLQSWSVNKEVREALLSAFAYADAPRIVILNLPDNVNGTYMFRTFHPDNSFAETYEQLTGKSIEAKTQQILEYNMLRADDGVQVNVLNDSSLQVGFKQGGNWWWHGGIGAGNYETDHYRVVFDESKLWYTVVFKQKIPGTVYIYQDGKTWEKVKGL